MMRQIRTNEPTRYELIATNGERTVLVEYTARKSRMGGLAMLTDMVTVTHRHSITSGRVVKEMRIRRLARATATDAEAWQTGCREIASCGDWKVKFSGRTQRECQTLGELSDTIYLEKYDG